MQVTVCDNCGNKVDSEHPTCSIQVRPMMHRLGEDPASIEGDYCAECSKQIKEAVTEVLNND